MDGYVCALKNVPNSTYKIYLHRWKWGFIQPLLCLCLCCWCCSGWCLSVCSYCRFRCRDFLLLNVVAVGLSCVLSLEQIGAFNEIAVAKYIVKLTTSYYIFILTSSSSSVPVSLSLKSSLPVLYIFPSASTSAVNESFCGQRSWI